MLAFDAVAVALLLLAVPRAPARSSAVRPRAVACALLVAGSVAAVAVTGTASRGSRPTEDGQLPEPGGTVFLRHSEWIGKRLPLAAWTKPHIDLRNGPAVVMFYHRDCVACQEAMPAVVAFARSSVYSAGAVPRVTLVEVPPSDPVPQESGSAYARARLSDRYTWKVRTPSFVFLNDGVVERVSDSFAGLNLSHPGTAVEPAPSRAFPDYRSARQEQFLKEIACGPLALLAILRAERIDVSPVERDGLIAAAGSRGLDMKQLQERAEQHGLHALGAAVSAQDLRRMGKRAIVLLNAIGYVAVTGYTPDGFTVEYPNRPPGVLPDDVFVKAFGDSGAALLVARKPLEHEQLGLSAPLDPKLRPGAGLRLSRSMLSVGRTYSHQWEASVQVHNDGTEPVELLDPVPSCNQLKATLDRKAITPGGTATLTARGTTSTAGGFTFAVRLQTTAPAGDGITVPVRGYTDLPVGLERPAIHLPSVRPGQSARVEVPIDLSPGVASADLIATVPAGAPVKVSTLASADQQPRLVIEWEGSPAVGLHRYELGIKSARFPSPVAAPLSIAVEVVPAIDTFPADLTMAATEANARWQRKIKIRTDDSPVAPEILFLDPTWAEQIKVSVVREGPGEYTAELVLSAPLKTTGANETEIRVRHHGAEAPVRLLRLPDSRQ